MAQRTASISKPAGGPPRFDVDTLREIAGEKVFARGTAYHQNNQVEIVAIDRARVVAKVLGSEVYRSELAGTGKKFSGECSCPAYSDWGFCKHLVAAALTANSLGPEELERAAGRLAKVRDHLRAKGIEPLIEMIMEFAERDPALLSELELAAAMVSADDETLFAQFKKSITEATRTGGYVEYQEARAWAEGVESLIDRIAGLVKMGRAALSLRLLDHFFKRMDQALSSMDDSDGQGAAVYSQACEVHLAACIKAKPDSIALARELFAHEVESEWDFFHGASDTYADVLGSAGSAEYRRLASEAWQKIKPLRASGRQAQDDEFGARYRLATILKSFAKREGDIEAAIAIQSKDLSTPHAYLEIAKLYVDHGRETDALKWAEEGLWQFEDRPDERLIFFAVELYGRAGRKDEAVDLLWKAFEKRPSIWLYKKLKAATKEPSPGAGATRERAIGLLRAKLGKADAIARWSTPKEILIQILISEKLMGEAWEVVRKHGCSDALLDVLAEASEESHPADVLALHERRVDQLARLGGQSNYQAIINLLSRMAKIRERQGEHAQQAIYVADLMTRYKTKRNLLKLLQQKHNA